LELGKMQKKLFRWCINYL